MKCFKHIIHYESTIIISLPCIQLAKLKSCSVWSFSEGKKKAVHWWHGGCMGHLALPRLEALPPHTSLTRTKMAKISHFWLFIFLFPPPPHPTPPHPNKKIIWCSHWKNSISNMVLRLVKIFSGVKIHAIWRLVLRLVKYSLTSVKYKLLDKNTNWTTEYSNFTTNNTMTSGGNKCLMVKVHRHHHVQEQIPANLGTIGPSALIVTQALQQSTELAYWGMHVQWHTPKMVSRSVIFSTPKSHKITHS